MNSRCGQSHVPSEGSRRIFLASSLLPVVAGSPWHSLTYRCVTPTSASVVTWPSLRSFLRAAFSRLLHLSGCEQEAPQSSGLGLAASRATLWTVTALLDISFVCVLAGRQKRPGLWWERSENGMPSLCLVRCSSPWCCLCTAPSLTCILF